MSTVPNGETRWRSTINGFNSQLEQSHSGIPSRSLSGSGIATIQITAEESHFRRQTDEQSRIVSLCSTCWEIVALSADIWEVELSEATHECPLRAMAEFS
jgi:hypothetical protein